MSATNNNVDVENNELSDDSSKRFIKRKSGSRKCLGFSSDSCELERNIRLSS